MRKSNYPLLMVLVLAVFILPATVYLALTNKENRSSAAGNTDCLIEDMGCGPRRCGIRFCPAGKRCILNNRFPNIERGWTCIDDSSCKRVSLTPSPAVFCVREGQSIPVTPQGALMKCCQGLLLCPPAPGIIGNRGTCRQHCLGLLTGTPTLPLTPPPRPTYIPTFYPPTLAPWPTGTPTPRPM